MEAQIQNGFKKCTMGTGKTFSLINNYLNANSHQDKLNIIVTILKECCFYLRSISAELSEAQLSEFSNILHECFKSTSGTSNHEEIAFKIVKCLFFIMSDLIKFNHNKECLKLATYTVGQFNTIIGTNKLNVTPDLEIIVKNCYLLFWNHGVKLSQQYNFEDCSRYFLHALECLSHFTTSLDDITYRAIKASSAIANYALKLDYFKLFNEVILNALKAFSDIPESEIPETLLSLYKWNHAYAVALRKENNSSWPSILLQSNILLDKFAPGITRSLKVTPILACSKCLELLTCGLERYTKPAHVKTSKTFTKTFLHLERIFSKTFVLQNKTVHQFALDVSQVLLDSIPDITPEVEANMNEDLLVSLKSTYFFHLHLLSVLSDENKLQTRYPDSINMLQSLFHLFMRLAKGEILFSLVMTDATAAISKISSFFNVNVDEALGERIANLGLILANLGTIAYGKNMYAEAIPFLKESCNILLKWCKQIKNEINNRLTKVKLENKHSMLIACLRKIHDFPRCMKLLTDIIPVYSDSSSTFISYWILIQVEMKSLNSNYVRKTIRQGFSDYKVSLSDDKLFELLQLELQTLKQQKYDTHAERYCVVLAMGDVAASTRCANLNTAIVLLELAQIQWFKAFDGEKSAKCCCQEALTKLNEILNKTLTPSNEAGITIYCARAFYWQYLIGQRESQRIAQDEMSKIPTTPFELKLLGRQDGEDEDCDPIEDRIHGFVNTTVSEELESLAPLNRATNLWTAVIDSDMVPLSSSEQILIELQTAAEIYSLARQENKEKKLWRLGRRLALRYDSHSTYVICTSRLIRVLCGAGDAKEALEILKSCEPVLPKLQTDKSEHVYALLRYQLAFVELSFFVKDVNEGLKVLRDVWNHSFLEKKTRFSVLLCGEMRVIAGQFIRLPPDIYETKINLADLPWGTSNAIELVLEGMNSFLKLVRESSEGDCHYVTASLMNAHMLLVQLSIEIGATREARWFLKEQFNNSHSLALGVRMSEFMLGLARLDLVCDKKKTCLWKLQTIQFLLDKEDLRSLEIDDTTSKLTKTDRLLLSKLNVYLPQYFGHSTQCTCSKCQTPILHLLALQLLNLYVEHFSIYGSTNDAFQLARIAFNLSSIKLTKYSALIAMCEARLNTSRLLSSECKYIEAITMIEKSIKKLEALPYACNKLAVLLPELIYQRSICCVNILAAHQKLDVLNLVDSLWSINRRSGVENGDGPKIRNLGLLKLAVTPRQPLSPIKLRPPNQDCRSVCRDPSLLPQNLMNAPERNSRRLYDKWEKFEEPGSDEEGNVPRRRKRELLSNRVLAFDADNLGVDGAESIEGETTSKLSDFLLLPLTDNAHSETVRVETARTKTSRGSSRKVQPKCNKENLLKSGNKSASVPSSDRVTRSRVRKMTFKANTENLRSNSDDEKNLSIKLDFDVDVDVSSSFDDEVPDTIAIDCEIAPIEILRGGRREANKKTDTLEEKEIPRNVDDCVKENINFDLAFETTVESITGKKLALDVIIGWLEKALSLISHHPIYPLYPNLCFLLALFKGPSDPLCSYYLSESTFITLRHQCIINLGKKLTKKLNSEENSIRLANYYNTLNFTAATIEEKKKNLDNHIKCLPEDWTVCQISFIPDAIQKLKRNVNQPLVLTRFQRGKKPAVVRAPTATYKPEEVPCTLLDEFERINEANRNTMKSDDRVIWWQSRRSLDERMKNFIADLENIWIGYWKGLFLGRPVSKDDQQRLTAVTREILDTVGNKCNVDKEDLEIFLDSTPWLTDEQFQLGISDLFGFKEKSTDADELIEFIKTKMEPVNCTEINRQPVILILSKEIECLPWESMPIIRDKSVSRMPSLCLLDGHLSWQMSQPTSVFEQGVDIKSTYFVLNPSDDLPHTQKTFEDWFTNTQNWPGVVGRPPTEKEFSDGLTLHDLFIYCGHGSGGKYLSGDLIQRLYCSAVTLLMGCSSGKLRSLGRGLEPSGTVLQYLLAGCPSVVADLWDVTDRDIDRFLESLLNLWLESDGENLCNIIPEARLVCRLPYLIGAAPVTYGLPVNTKCIQ